jgi:hypothetical protein
MRTFIEKVRVEQIQGKQIVKPRRYLVEEHPRRGKAETEAPLWQLSVVFTKQQGGLGFWRGESEERRQQGKEQANPGSPGPL